MIALAASAWSSMDGCFHTACYTLVLKQSLSPPYAAGGLMADELQFLPAAPAPGASS